jgi:hypothetical protein
VTAVSGLAQQLLLDRIRALAEATPEVVGLLVLGSLATGTADEFSDLDLGLYVADEALETFDIRGWLESVAPVATIFTNEYACTVLFRDLVRAEIHFGSLAKADDWSGMAGLVAYPSLPQMVLLDRTGTLAVRVRPLAGPLPSRGAKEVDREFAALVDSLLVADACRRRGELARALAHLSSTQVPLLRLARLAEGATDEWVAPARRLERELSRSAYKRYALTTASLADDQLEHAIAAAWQWGKELAAGAAARLFDEETTRAIARRLAHTERRVRRSRLRAPSTQP